MGRMGPDDPELDPRLAAQYDLDNPWADDDEFFLGLANRSPASRIADIGCGTGRLTTALALAGHAVTGVDPNPAFLALARAKPGAERVAWVRGTAADLPPEAFDLALMTSHVAQVFLGDDEWLGQLREVRRVLVPGGRLAFDTRDPAARAWERWPRGRSRTTLPDGTVLDSDTTMAFADDVAWFESEMVLSDGAGAGPGATHSRARWGYRFRSAELVRQSLAEAGFRVDALFGGWHEEPLGEGCGEIVVVASR